MPVSQMIRVCSEALVGPGAEIQVGKPEAPAVLRGLTCPQDWLGVQGLASDSQGRGSKCWLRPREATQFVPRRRRRGWIGCGWRGMRW